MSFASSLNAQTNVPPHAQPPIQNRPVVVTPPANRPPDAPKRPERPVVPGQPVPTQEIKDLVREFQATRKEFLIKQQEARERLRTTVTEREREAIRAQMKEDLQRWMEVQKAQVQDLKDQAKEMKANLRSVIDSGSGEGRNK